MSEQFELMLYADGELAPEEAWDVAQRIAADPRRQQELAALRDVSALVRAVALARVSVQEPLTDEIMRRIEAEPSGSAGTSSSCAPIRASDSPCAPVSARSRSNVSFETVQSQPVSTRTDSSRTRRWTMPIRTPIRAWVSIGAGLMAVAALLLLYLSGVTAEVPRRAASMLSGQSLERANVSIEEVDFGAQNAAIFWVSGQTGGTPVVWLMEEPRLAGPALVDPAVVPPGSVHPASVRSGLPHPVSAHSESHAL